MRASRLLPVYLFISATLLLSQTEARAADLNAVALHDIPQPVAVRVQGWNASCTEIFDSTMLWPDGNNMYGTETLVIPSTPQTLRFTFQNDSFGGTPDTDRNLFLDAWDIDGGTVTQGEDFERTGGPDENFPGCGIVSWLGRTVTDCGNMFDWVEFGSETEVTCIPADCSDDFDNDGDGLTDCSDADCDGVGICEFGEELSCLDGFDNDADGVIDCDDPDCGGVGLCIIELICDDALDNDQDGVADCEDADCAGVGSCPDFVIPTLGSEGLVALATLLVAAMLWMARRRRAAP